DAGTLSGRYLLAARLVGTARPLPSTPLRAGHSGGLHADHRWPDALGCAGNGERIRIHGLLPGRLWPSGCLLLCHATFSLVFFRAWRSCSKSSRSSSESVSGKTTFTFANRSPFGLSLPFASSFGMPRPPSRMLRPFWVSGATLIAIRLPFNVS